MRLDLRSLEPSPAEFVAALSAELGLAADGSAIGTLGTRGRVVLLVDTFEFAVGLEDWRRTRFVPSPPAGALVVIAGRVGPGVAWRRELGWRMLLPLVALRNLLPGEVRDPLALWLLIELLEQHGGEREGPPPALGAAPDVVRALLEEAVRRMRLASEDVQRAGTLTAAVPAGR